MFNFKCIVGISFSKDSTFHLNVAVVSALMSGFTSVS